MRGFSVILAGVLATATSAAVVPLGFNHTLLPRDGCPEGQYCDECYVNNNCNSESTTIGIHDLQLNVGDLDLGQLADVIASCYENGNTGLAACNPSGVDFGTRLENGNSATVTVTLSTPTFPSWAKNLFVATVKSALTGAARKNSVTLEDGSNLVSSTVPDSLFIALWSSTTQSVTFGLKVTEDTDDSNACGDILGVGGAIAGAAGPEGAAIGAALTIASVYCNQ